MRSLKLMILPLIFVAFAGFADEAPAGGQASGQNTEEAKNEAKKPTPKKETHNKKPEHKK
jgi:hypothetical protein